MFFSKKNTDLMIQKNGKPERVFLNTKSINRQLYEDLIELSPDSSNQLKQKIYDDIQGGSRQGYGNAEHIAMYYFPLITHILYYCPEYTENLLPILLDPLLCIVGEDDTDKLIDVIQQISSENSTKNSSFITVEGIDWIKNKLPLQRNFLNQFLINFWEKLNSLDK